jgi:hypothetical protein
LRMTHRQATIEVVHAQGSLRQTAEPAGITRINWVKPRIVQSVPEASVSGGLTATA